MAMKDAVLSCLSSYSYTNNGCIEVFTQTPSPTSSNFDDSLCFYGDFSSAHSHFDLQNTQSARSILVSDLVTSNIQGETQLNYMPPQEDIFNQPWECNYVQPSTNEIQLIQNARKKDVSKKKVAKKRSTESSCRLINSATNKREREKKGQACFQGKLPNREKEKEPNVRKRSQKLTDKITALQKLVSPYGKTDTASVLLEASVSIKALQDQIEDICHKISREQTTNMTGEKRSDLQSRGLCLVPSVILEELEKRLPMNYHHR